MPENASVGTAKVPILILVEFMVVFDTPLVAFPVSRIVHLPVMTGRHPTRAFIRRTRPVSFMPDIFLPNRIPIAIDPKVFWPGCFGSDFNDLWRGRGTDLNTNRNLTESRSGEQQNG